jgi:5'-3' exonuclease
MKNPESPIIDLYPTDFELDANGIPAKRKWQWVILLPFSDQTRVLAVLKEVQTIYFFLFVMCFTFF